MILSMLWLLLKQLIGRVLLLTSRNALSITFVVRNFILIGSGQ